MQNTWGETYVDPYKACRARFFQASRISCGTALWGRGIFVPRFNEIPIGDVHLSLQNPDDKSWGPFEPVLIDQTREPVGLYRGQSALLFSGDPTLTLGVRRKTL